MPRSSQSIRTGILLILCLSLFGACCAVRRVALHHKHPRHAPHHQHHRRRLIPVARYRMLATAFLAKCGGHSRCTATGRRAAKGAIAVNPRIIHLGTLLHVQGYGWGRAVDTGRLGPGRIDVCFPSPQQARRWGRRKVWVVAYRYR